MTPTPVLLKTCLRVSLFSLLLGTGMFTWFFFASNLMIGFVSAPIVLAIGLYNLAFLLQLLLRGYKEKENRKVIWRTVGIMSLNIPAALFYTKLVLILCNTLLVRLVNTTSQPLHNLVLLGCGAPRPLADLQPGQATILWLPISHASCFERTVSVQYTSGRVTQQAMIDAYVVEGKRLNVSLGNNQQVAVTKRY